MKTFKDLKFTDHPYKDNPTVFGSFNQKSRLDFPNGFGVSVISGGTGVYADDAHPYELAVFKDGELTYDTPITGDVIGHCDEEDITELMAQVQALPSE